MSTEGRGFWSHPSGSFVTLAGAHPEDGQGAKGYAVKLTVFPVSRREEPSLKNFQRPTYHGELLDAMLRVDWLTKLIPGRWTWKGPQP